MKENNWHFVAGVLVTFGLLTNPVSGQNTTLPVGAEQALASPAEEVVSSLDGTWEYETLDGRTGSVKIPCRWDRIDGLRSAHEVTFVRRFDLPSQFAHPGQRILVRCDAIGEFGELSINGKFAGEILARPLPAEFDITGLVSVPSTDNVLSIRVKDDTHFSVPRPSKDWRDRRHWIPHGIGGNNRKGLFQSVSLRGRPGVHIRDLHIQTSVRKHRLTVVYELFNSGRESVSVKLDASAGPSGSDQVELTMPSRELELPGQVVTAVSITTPWNEPKLWQPNHPHRYVLRSVLTSADGKHLHQRDDRFGFREVWFEDIHFYLNGIRCNLRGESPSYAQNARMFDQRDTTAAAIRKCLDANFNVLRFHAAPAPPHVYDVCDELGMMGLQTRGYRYANWCDIRPYNPHYTGFMDVGGLKPGYEEAWDIIVKSFAPVAVFDKHYDELGPFPKPPRLEPGMPEIRTLIVYNDTFESEDVTVQWNVRVDDHRIAGDSKKLRIPLGAHVELDIEFTPDREGILVLELASLKQGKEQFADARQFVVRRAREKKVHAQANPADGSFTTATHRIARLSLRPTPTLIESDQTHFIALGGQRIEAPLTTGQRNVYRLASAELDGRTDAREIVGSTYDNRVCAFAASGRHLWDTPVGGFVFDLTAGDLDGDGKDEILAACADGYVYAIGADGKLRWQQNLGAPVWQVATARLNRKTRVALAGGISRRVFAFSADGKRLWNTRAGTVNGVIRLLRAGDFDGDGNDEVAVLPVRGQAKDIVFLKIPGLAPRQERIAFALVPWDSSTPGRKKVGEQFRKGKRPWNAKTLRTANGIVADLDGDGADELIFNSGVYSLKNGPHQMVKFPDPFKVPSYDQFYKMRMVAVGDLTAAPGNEVVLLEGCEIRLLDQQGQQLGVARAPFGFTDVIYQPGSPRGHVLLGSSPNGDDNLYRLRFDAGWQGDVATLKRRGVMGAIETNLEDLATAIGQWRGHPMVDATGPYDVVVDHHMWSGPDLKKIDTWIGVVRAYEKAFPYANLRFATCFWPGEDAPLLRPDGKAWGRDTRLAHDVNRAQIVAGVKRFEAANCRFWVQVGHGCDPHCEIATIAAILDAAPHTCLGFVSAEDEQLGAVPYYFEHHIRPILDLCLKYKKRFILRNKDVWWLHWPADSRLKRLIFDGRYRSVILPSVEDSNSRTTDAQLAARVGLWLDGQVDDWCCRVSADWFGTSRSWEWEFVMTGHPHLRYLTSQASLGARVFMFLSGERARRTGQWTRVGKEGVTNFLNLLGKGILVPPHREQLRAISPVVLAVQDPTKRFAEHGANGHHLERWNDDGTDTQRWAFDRLDCYWAMAPLPRSDVSTLLWGRTRRSSENLVVTAPHGFVCVLPGGPPTTPGRWSSVWTTDGDSLAKGQQRMSLTEACGAITTELTAAAKAFPFRVEGRVFHQIIEQDPGHFVIVLIDPGWLDPADRDVKIIAGTPGAWSVSDRLTSELLGDLRQPMALCVPAGLFRLLDIRKATY